MQTENLEIRCRNFLISTYDSQRCLKQSFPKGFLLLIFLRHSHYVSSAFLTLSFALILLCRVLENLFKNWLHSDSLVFSERWSDIHLSFDISICEKTSKITRTKRLQHNVYVQCTRFSGKYFTFGNLHRNFTFEILQTVDRRNSATVL